MKTVLLLLFMLLTQAAWSQERTIATFQVVGILIDGMELPHASPLAVDYKFTAYNGNLYFADGFQKGVITSLEYGRMENGINYYAFIWESNDMGIKGNVFIKNENGRTKYYINVEHIGVEKPGNELIFVADIKEYSTFKATLDMYLNSKTNRVRKDYNQCQLYDERPAEWSKWFKSKPTVILNANANNDIYHYSAKGNINRYRLLESWTRGYNANIGAYSAVRVEHVMMGVKRTGMLSIYDAPANDFLLIYEDSGFGLHFSNLEEE
jgi:hypothetical protein